jgi:threonine dehydrogenase-like Zn-dependent dehydrogenase
MGHWWNNTYGYRCWIRFPSGISPILCCIYTRRYRTWPCDNFFDFKRIKIKSNYTGTPFLARIMAGLLKPKNKVLGIDLAGRVEAVGANVKGFLPGDEVFGSTDHGCFAEYVSVSEDEVQLKPTNMTFAEAAAIVAAASTALHGLRDHGQIQPGQKV